MQADDYAWTRFELVFYYDQAIEEVFAAWATGAGLESFFIENALFTSRSSGERKPQDIIESNDTYRWEWRHAASLDGKITGVERNRRIEFTFGEMNVSVKLSTVGEQTELHLVQTDIPDTAHGRVFGHLNCRSCWIFFLTNLKSVLDQGIDLRVADPSRVSSMEVGFEPLSRRDGGVA
jgi:uncharacterized protein YndB with AHSA1/START domain